LSRNFTQHTDGENSLLNVRISLQGNSPTNRFSCTCRAMRTTNYIHHPNLSRNFTPKIIHTGCHNMSSRQKPRKCCLCGETHRLTASPSQAAPGAAKSARTTPSWVEILLQKPPPPSNSDTHTPHADTSHRELNLAQVSHVITATAPRASTESEGVSPQKIGSGGRNQKRRTRFRTPRSWTDPRFRRTRFRAATPGP